jgi:hypothetical protein
MTFGREHCLLAVYKEVALFAGSEDHLLPREGSIAKKLEETLSVIRHPNAYFFF